jgi:hypothetical protein
MSGDPVTGQIRSQIISRRRLFWLAVTTVALAAPITVLATSIVSAQQANDQAPVAGEQTPPKKKKKKKGAPASTTPPANAPAQPKQQ